MTKNVTLEELREHLSECIEEVRKGDVTLRVVEGETTLAEIRPPQENLFGWVTENGRTYRPAKGHMKDFVPPPPLDPPIDILAILDEIREDKF